MKEKEIAESRIGLHRLCAMRSRLVVARLHDRREPKRQMRVKDYGVEWAKPQRAVGGGDRLDRAGSEAVHGRAKIKRRGARRIQRQGAFDGAQRRPSFPRQQGDDQSGDGQRRRVIGVARGHDMRMPERGGLIGLAKAVPSEENLVAVSEAGARRDIVRVDLERIRQEHRRGSWRLQAERTS